MTSPMLQRAALIDELGQLTKWPIPRILDIEKLPAADQQEAIEDLEVESKWSWAEEPSAFARALAILNLLAAIASPISTIAGGFSGVGSAITTLRGV